MKNKIHEEKTYTFSHNALVGFNENHWGGWVGRRRSKRRQHLPKILKFFGMTDRPTDRQTLWFIGKLHFQKKYP